MLNKLFEVWDKVEMYAVGYTGYVLLLTGTILACAEVVRRYLFGATFRWSEEVIIYSLLFSGFLYLGRCLKERGHLRVDVIDILLGEKGSNILHIFQDVVGAAVSAAMVGYSIRIIAVLAQSTSKTFLLRVPTYTIFVFLCFGFLVLLVAYIQEICVLVGHMSGSRRRD